MRHFAEAWVSDLVIDDNIAEDDYFVFLDEFVSG